MRVFDVYRYAWNDLTIFGKIFLFPLLIVLLLPVVLMLLCFKEDE